MTRIASILMALIVAPSMVLADVIHLRSGGSIAGSVRPIVVGKQKMIVVDIGNGIQVSLGAGEVARIESEGEQIVRYRQLVEAAGNDPEKHWELARWCKANAMLPQYDRQVRHVIRLDPEHAVARQSLGYTKLEDGRWMLHDELQRSRGLVHHLGKWKVPSDVEMTEAAEEF
ncbi:MAG: hypothetical protein R3C05_19580 [Pirellulaceae bacterium]